jgi:hypothetical protein
MVKGERRKDIQRAIDAVERRNNGPYDGVFMGKLPVWIPPILADEFTEARRVLLDKYKYSEAAIRQFITENTEIYAEALARNPGRDICIVDMSRWVAAPFDCWPYLSTVRLTNSIFALGELEGLRAWVGKTADDILAAAARKNVARSGGKHARPQALRKLIVEMVQANPQIKPADVRANLAELSAKPDSIIKRFDKTARVYEWIDENSKLQKSSFSGIPDLLAKVKKSLK